MIFPKVQFVARGRSPRATKHRGKNEHSLQKYIQSVPKKKDESIAPLFIGGFQLSIHQIKWLLIGYKIA
jgi:hypothetical protein